LANYPTTEIQKATIQILVPDHVSVGTYIDVFWSQELMRELRIGFSGGVLGPWRAYQLPVSASAQAVMELINS
jgi:hypothetical protein